MNARPMLLYFFAMITFAHSEVRLNPCQGDQARLSARSRELQAIVQADQADRQNWDSKTDDEMSAVAKRDETRRKRVGEIFGEGCFAKAEDYAAAALVFQHGDAPDHFFQTYVWAKRAVELGDPSQKRVMAMGIDRYLVNIGQKQLFGTQATKPDTQPGTCWCLQAVQPGFPESLRKRYAGKSYAEALAWVEKMNRGKACAAARECSGVLKPSLKGSVPGIW